MYVYMFIYIYIYMHIYRYIHICIYVAAFATVIACPVIAFPFALAFGLSRFRTISRIMSDLTAVEAIFALSFAAFAFDKVQLPIFLLDKLSFDMPSCIVNWPPCVVQ